MAEHDVRYAKYPRTGRYVIRVVGPHAAFFEGRRVLVHLKSGGAREEYLEELLSWEISADGDETVAYYAFITRISNLYEAVIPLFEENIQ